MGARRRSTCVVSPLERREEEQRPGAQRAPLQWISGPLSPGIHWGPGVPEGGVRSEPGDPGILAW